MISAIRNNRKILVTSILFVILGAWLPLVCQHCLAYADMNPDVQQDVSHERCMQAHHPDGKNTGFMNVHQPDLCSCSSQQLLELKVNKPCNQIAKVNIHKMPPNLFLAGLSAPVAIQITGPGIKPFIPDRACYHPLERNCIQLK